MKYGRYTVLSDAGSKNGMRQVLCKCDCGTERVVYLKNLKSGNSTSCGCQVREKTSKRNYIHGMSKGPTWTVWVCMRQRCSPSASGKDRDWYFLRGIQVCDRWEKFENFFEDMGEKPSGMSIDRIDNSKGYSPENCRWATAKQQARNTRRNKIITIGAESRVLAEWIEITGTNVHTYRTRLRRGMSEMAALGLVSE